MWEEGSKNPLLGYLVTSLPFLCFLWHFWRKKLLLYTISLNFVVSCIPMMRFRSWIFSGILELLHNLCVAKVIGQIKWHDLWIRSRLLLKGCLIREPALFYHLISWLWASNFRELILTCNKFSALAMHQYLQFNHYLFGIPRTTQLPFLRFWNFLTKAIQYWNLWAHEVQEEFINIKT